MAETENDGIGMLFKPLSYDITEERFSVGIQGPSEGEATLTVTWSSGSGTLSATPREPSSSRGYLPALVLPADGNRFVAARTFFLNLR